MVYLLNTEISDKKTVQIGLQNIFGIGKFQADKICNQFGISKETKIQELSQDVKNKIVIFIEANFEIGDNLRQNIAEQKSLQTRIRCYKGQRAKFKLPRRGQRTHTNSKTVKKIR